MENDYQEINIKEILRAIIKKIWLIVLLMIIGATIAHYITVNYIVPTYQANTVLFIGREENIINGVGLSLNDLYINDQLFIDYQQLAGTRLVVDEVRKNLKTDISFEDFRRSMDVYTIGKSRLFGVSFKSSDPEFAAAASNELAKQITLAAAKIVNVQNIRIIDKAIVPTKQIAPNSMMNTVVAGFLGVFLGLLIIFIQVLFDNTIKSEEDVERLTKLPIIGVIPKFRGEIRR